ITNLCQLQESLRNLSVTEAEIHSLVVPKEMGAGPTFKIRILGDLDASLTGTIGRDIELNRQVIQAARPRANCSSREIGLIDKCGRQSKPSPACRIWMG